MATTLQKLTVKVLIALKRKPRKRDQLMRDLQLPSAARRRVCEILSVLTCISIIEVEEDGTLVAHIPQRAQ